MPTQFFLENILLSRLTIGNGTWVDLIEFGPASKLTCS